MRLWGVNYCYFDGGIGLLCIYFSVFIAFQILLSARSLLCELGRGTCAGIVCRDLLF